jgi:hypothetical protein
VAVLCNKSCIMAVFEQEVLELLLLKRHSAWQILTIYLALPRLVAHTSVYCALQPFWYSFGIHLVYNSKCTR